MSDNDNDQSQNHCLETEVMDDQDGNEGSNNIQHTLDPGLFQLVVSVREKKKIVPDFKSESQQAYRDREKHKENNNIINNDSDKVMAFMSGNPRVEVVVGRLHLFKGQGTSSQTNTLPFHRGRLVCVLAVPTFLSTTDFLDFMSPLVSHVEYLRILKDNNINKYMALMKFSEQEHADEFYTQFNGKTFTSFDPEQCHIVFVSKVEFVDAPPSESRIDRFFTHTLTAENPDHTQLIELPTCPVCLERLDSNASGILTTLCNHSFHVDCLQKWGEGSCPICRYTQEESQSHCATCGIRESLWICMICGHVGCGRYENGHAFDHFKTTKHTYAMELQSRRVWDYVGDGYVHRLVQNVNDGKLVEIPDPENSKKFREGLDPESQDILDAQFASKVDMICMEYNNLLAQQLDSQRRYFEDMIEQKDKESKSKINSLRKENSKLENKMKETSKTEQKLRNRLEETQKELSNFKESLEKSEKERGFLRDLNNSLISDQKKFKHQLSKKESELTQQIQQKDAQINDLEEQTRDLLLNLEMKQKLENHGNEDIKNGSMIISNPSSSHNNTRGKRRGNAGRRKRK